MKLEEQVTSLELSKKLKELGVKQESLYEWSREHGRKDFELHAYERIGEEDETEFISAYTVAELKSFFPQIIGKDGVHYRLKIVYSINWEFYYSHGINIVSFIASIKDTDADAFASFLLYLLENRFIDPTWSTLKK